MKNTAQKLSVLAVLAIVTVSIAAGTALTAPSTQPRGTNPAMNDPLAIEEIMPDDAYLAWWPISQKVIRPKFLASQSRTFQLPDGEYYLVD